MRHYDSSSIRLMSPSMKPFQWLVVITKMFSSFDGQGFTIFKFLGAEK